MKDYSSSREDSKLFVLNYDVVDDQIIVNVANGRQYTVKYTEENEKIILKKMEDQVKDGQRNKNSINWQYYGGIFTMGLWGGLAVYNAVRLVGHYGDPSLEWVYWALAIGNGGLAAISTASVVDTKRKLDDLKKNMMFLDNKKLFEERVKTDDELLVKDNDNTLKQTITINDIHDMTNDQVEAMVDCALFSKETGMIVSPVTDSSVKKKVRKL